MQDWLFLIFPSILSPPKEVFWGILFNRILVPTSLFNSICYPFSLHSLQLIIILFIYLFLWIVFLKLTLIDTYLISSPTSSLLRNPCYCLDDHGTKVNKNTHFLSFLAARSGNVIQVWSMSHKLMIWEEDLAYLDFWRSSCLQISSYF